MRTAVVRHLIEAVTGPPVRFYWGLAAEAQARSSGGSPVMAGSVPLNSDSNGYADGAASEVSSISANGNCSANS
ncbi:hypothetical protein NIIDNTM18_30570 [Mycolicibacterium litorale]|uniref:Uncharacterized protein n=1 Tax=Mycolicibacterium litorale TaxID=758802 RepID=A0A6S6P5T5_9MYCO|nr:hypothetical protein NIIDNTM18_30570 [Mycolicibacterium litorale]